MELSFYRGSKSGNSPKEFVIKKIFATGSFLGLRATVFVALSLVFIFCDYWWQCFIPARLVINAIISPLYFVADAPVAFSNWLGENLATRHRLIKENTRLKEEQLLLATKVQRLSFLEKENAELKSQLELAQKLGDRHISAEIMAVHADNFSQQVIVNKGQNVGVYMGQPVLDAYGIIGQVITPNAFFSRVMLITDSKSAIPVINTRNGIRALAVGTGDPNTLELANLPDTADVKVGDVLVTSGVGIKLPSGYIVGMVSKIEHIVGERFAKITVFPYAHVDSSRFVVMLWPKEVKNSVQQGVKSEKYQKNNLHKRPL